MGGLCQVNYLGAYALTRLLLEGRQGRQQGPEAAPPVRVRRVGGGGPPLLLSPLGTLPASTCAQGLEVSSPF